MRSFFLGAAVMLAGCTGASSVENNAFFENLEALCGGSYLGQITSDQAVDADWIASILIVGPVRCDADEIRLPLAVGPDQSRTWVVTRHRNKLEFRHEHIEPDGSPSDVTEYGGFARQGGTATRQDFPADKLTIENFEQNNLLASVTNVWTLSLEDGVFGYSLARPATDVSPARDFRAEFIVQP